MSCEHCDCEDTVSVEVSESLYEKLEHLERKLFKNNEPNMDGFIEFVLSEFVCMCEEMQDYTDDDYELFLKYHVGSYRKQLRNQLTT